jgi:hypothetical protein
MKYKGFDIKQETEHWFGSKRPVTVIYFGDKLMARVSDDAAKHVVDMKLKSGEWKNGSCDI